MITSLIWPPLAPPLVKLLSANKLDHEFLHSIPCPDFWMSPMLYENTPLGPYRWYVNFQLCFNSILKSVCPMIRLSNSRYFSGFFKGVFLFLNGIATGPFLTFSWPHQRYFKSHIKSLSVKAKEKRKKGLRKRLSLIRTTPVIGWLFWRPHFSWTFLIVRKNQFLIFSSRE